jgi:hypothetical protein
MYAKNSPLSFLLWNNFPASASSHADKPNLVSLFKFREYFLDKLRKKNGVKS